MNRHTAISAKGLSPEERKARLGALAAKGDISAKHAALVNVREPSAKARAFGATLQARAKQFLGKNRRAAA